MVEPKGPPSLSKLACVAMCKASKEGKFKPSLDLQTVPPGDRKIIWDHCNLMEIITLSSAMGSTNFFSSIIRRKKRTVKFTKFNEKFGAFNITCTGKAQLRWNITFASYPNDIDAMRKIGSVHYETKTNCDLPEIKNFKSNLPYELQIVDWILQLFQKERWTSGCSVILPFDQSLPASSQGFYLGSPPRLSSPLPVSPSALRHSLTNKSEPQSPMIQLIMQYGITITHAPQLCMSFENKPDTTWVKRYSYEEDEDETDSEDEHSETSWSSEEEQDEDKEEKEQKTPRNEQFAKEYKSLSESIERFCKLFRTEIHELEIVWSNVKSDMFPDLKLWSRIKNARHVTIEKCEDSEILIELLSDRHARGLPTTTTNIIFNNPIQSSLDPFYNLNIRFAKLNIKNHTHSDFMELVEHLLPTADFLDFRIPGSLGQHVEQFKDRFMLQSLNPSYLMELASPEETELEKWLTGYITRHDGSAMAFFFVGGHYKGTFTRMVARHYVHKSTLPDIYEQVGSQWVERMR
ncbi:unnamed protein product [Caenorhabditis brenneri]